MISALPEFSWSYSRWKTFNKCKRAYYYRYCVPDGRDKYATPLVQKIYLLKNIIPLNIWVKNIIAESLRETLTLERAGNKMEFIKLLGNKIFRRYSRGFAELLNRDWLNDPRKLNLFELYYSRISMREIEEIPDRIKAFVSLLFDEGLCDELLAVDYLDWKTFSVPLSFELAGKKCWAAPELIWRARGKMKILFMNYGRITTPDGFWMLPAGLTALYTEKFYRISPDKIETKVFFSDGINSRMLSGFEAPVLVYDLIEKSSAQMISLAGNDENSYPRDRVSEAECENCAFRELCSDIVSQ